MKRVSLLLSCVCLLAAAARAQEVRYEIQFPDLPDYRTLKCDLHSHSVFSDGSVWPTVRTAEAWRQGLDATALTDHIEYQPHKNDVPTNHNRPYEISVGDARIRNLLYPRAAEITRDTPPGHFNAVFLEDAAALDTPEFIEALRQAKTQNAFVFWNHQGWKGEEKGAWQDIHTTLVDEQLFQGMEVCNGESYFPTAHRWCLEKGFTMLGNSDIHAPDLRTRSTADDHRTMTLVFAKERTLESLQEALVAGRTVVWYQNQLIGRKEWLEPVFQQSVQVAPSPYRSGNKVWLEVRNLCEVNIELQRTGNVGPETLSLPARATSLVKLTVPDAAQPTELDYTATNLLVAPGKGLPVILRVPGPEQP